MQVYTYHYLASTDGTSAEAKWRDVRMPPTARRVEEGVSAKVAAPTLLGPGPGPAAGGAAGALLDDWGGAVGGRAHHRVTLDLAPLAAGDRRHNVINNVRVQEDHSLTCKPDTSRGSPPTGCRSQRMFPRRRTSASCSRPAPRPRSPPRGPSGSRG